MGESVAEGTVTSWRKRLGDEVKSGEALVDVTTDKVDVEVPSPAAGRVSKILAQEGATVKVGAPLAEIDPSANGAAETRPPKAAEAKSSAAPATKIEQARPAQRPTQEPATSRDASPLARRAAAIRGVDLAKVAGNGPGATIRRDDVLNGEAAPAPELRSGTTDTAPVAKPPAIAAPPRVTLPAAVPTAATPQAVEQTRPQQTPPDKPVEQVRPLQPSSRAEAAPPLPPGATATPIKGPAASLVTYMEESLSIPTATSFRTMSVGHA